MIPVTIFLVASIATTAAVASEIECSEGTVEQGGVCVPCKPGSYWKRPPQYGDPKAATCRKCPPGTRQSAFGAQGPDLCHYCFPGTYAPKWGSTKCETCPSGTSSYYGWSKCGTCDPGSYFWPRDFGCMLCPIGYYSTEKNAVKCTKCPYLTTTKEKGASSINDCKPCTNGPACQKCRPSEYYQYYNPDKIPDSDVWWPPCRRCPSGTFHKGGGGISSEDQCQPCPAGTVRSAAGSSGTCMPCKGGKTTSAPGGMFCRRPDNPCPADTYEADDGNCKFCDRGYKFTPATRSCEKCPAEHVSSGGIRTKCFRCPGDLRPDRNQMFCVCGLGTYRMGMQCIPCPVGTFMDNPDHSEKQCMKCSEKVASRKGSARCEPCPLGLVPNDNFTACVKCPKNLMPSIVDPSRYQYDLAWHTGCVSPQTRCPPASKRSTSYAGVNPFAGCSFIPCTRDSVESDLGVNCIGCKKGFVLRKFGNGCSRCAPDSVTDGGLATECKLCPDGKAAVGEGDICGCYGRYRLDYGMQDGVCKPCPTGTYSGLNDDVCKRCESNRIVDVGNCRKCPSYKVPNKNQTACELCPMGTKPNRRYGANKCVSRNNWRHKKNTVGRFVAMHRCLRALENVQK